jgi:hypothetical protein
MSATVQSGACRSRCRNLYIAACRSITGPQKETRPKTVSWSLSVRVVSALCRAATAHGGSEKFGKVVRLLFLDASLARNRRMARIWPMICESLCRGVGRWEAAVSALRA